MEASFADWQLLDSRQTTAVWQPFAVSSKGTLQPFLYIFFSPKAVSRIKMLPGRKPRYRVVVLLYENDLKSAVNSKELTCHLPYITFFRK